MARLWRWAWLPRPRSLDAMADPIFTELVQRIRKHFFTQSSLD